MSRIEGLKSKNIRMFVVSIVLLAVGGSLASPYFVMVQDTLKTIAFIEKDTWRFPNTYGWAFAQWAYDAATDTFKPSELSPSGSECGFACDTTVAAKDYIFTAYPKR
jgi:Cytochrome P460